MFAPDEFTSPH